MQPVTDDNDALSHLLPHLDEALEELAEGYRQPLVLHHLEGRSYADCCRILGCNEGVLSMRLTRGREQLRRRLASRGAAVSALALGTLLGQVAAAGEMPAAVAVGAVQAAASGGAAGPVAAMVKNALSMLFWMKVKTAAIAAAAVLTVGTVAMPVVVHVMAAEAPKPVAAGDPPVPSATTAFVRPAVDPQLAAVLARRVELGTCPPRDLDDAVERILCALPPGDLLPVCLLRKGSVVDAICEPQRSAEIEQRFDQAEHRLLHLPTSGTVQEMIETIARQLDAEWIAAGHTVVLAPRYPALLRQHLFDPFADRSRSHEERFAAARRIMVAWDVDGLAALLRAQVATGDADGAEIARNLIAQDPTGLILKDCRSQSVVGRVGKFPYHAGLIALVRRRLDAGESARLANLALDGQRASGAPIPDIATIRLLTFLGEARSVPLLIQTLREAQRTGTKESASEAVAALGMIGGDSVVQALLGAFSSETGSEEVCGILRALGETRDPAAIQPLTAKIGDYCSDPKRLHAAIIALGDIGDPRGEPAVLAALSACTKKEYEYAGPIVGEALVRMRRANTGQELATLLATHPSLMTKMAASEALRALRDPRSVPTLLSATRSFYTGGDALYALRRIADPGTAAEFHRIILECDHDWIAGGAARALTRLQSPQSQVLLLDAFRRAPDTEDRIQRIGVMLDPAASATTADILRAIATTDPVANRRAMAAVAVGRSGPDGLAFLLGRINHEAAAEARLVMVDHLDGADALAHDCLLRLAAGDRDVQVRIRAIRRFELLTPDARIVPSLARLLAGDPNPTVRKASASALASLAVVEYRKPSAWGTDCDIMAMRIAVAQDQAAAIDGLTAALGREHSAEVRRAMIASPFSAFRTRSPATDRLAAAYLAALASETDVTVQTGLVQVFFSRMQADPALIPVMLGILNDTGRAAKVRESAYNNLKMACENPDTAQRHPEVVAAVKKFRPAVVGRQAGPASVPEPEPEVHDF